MPAATPLLPLLLLLLVCAAGCGAAAAASGSRSTPARLPSSWKASTRGVPK
jgi:hypothetical protein